MSIDVLPHFRPPTQSPARLSTLAATFRTIEFQVAVRDSRLDDALGLRFLAAGMDNSLSILDRNPVELWSLMASPSYVGNLIEADRYKSLLEFILSTGGRRYLNEPNASGLRPVDLANEMQLCILIERSDVDLNPTRLMSPLYRICTVGYLTIWYQRIINAVDPATLDWIHPTENRTALYQICRRIQIGPPYAEILRGLEILLSCVGYINPNHSCFFEGDPVQNADLDVRLQSARSLTKAYIQTELQPSICIAAAMLPEPVCWIVSSYCF